MFACPGGQDSSGSVEFVHGCDIVELGDKACVAAAFAGKAKSGGRGYVWSWDILPGRECGEVGLFGCRLSIPQV